MTLNMKRYVETRRRICRELDIPAAEALLFGVSGERPSSTKITLAMLHKVRCIDTYFTTEEKDLSKKWLLEQQFKIPEGY